MTENTQVAPYPTELAELVMSCRYKAGWDLHLTAVDYDRGQGSVGLTLLITVETPNSYHPEQVIRVAHLMPVPPASFGRDSWQRWLFEQLLLVERHEAAEFYVVDGEHPYAPHHGPGEDPYVVHDHGTSEQVRTSFRGEVKG